MECDDDPHGRPARAIDAIVGSIRSSHGDASRCADQEQPLIQSPEDEGPLRAMPESAQDHRQHQVADMSAACRPRLPPSGK